MQKTWLKWFMLGVILVGIVAACGPVGVDPEAAPAAVVEPEADARRWILQGQAAFAKGDFDQALELAQQAAGAAPRDATAWELVRQAAVAQAADDYLSRLPEDRYLLAPQTLLAEQVNGKHYTIIDVREPDEFVQGHIADAINIPLRELARRLDVLPTSYTQPVLVYCRTQKRATHALVVLRELGYTQVFNLEGGFEGYQAYRLENPLPTPGPTPTMDPARSPDRDGGC